MIQLAHAAPMPVDVLPVEVSPRTPSSPWMQSQRWHEHEIRRTGDPARRLTRGVRDGVNTKFADPVIQLVVARRHEVDDV